MGNLLASPFPFLAIKDKAREDQFGKTVRPTFCSTHFLPLGGSREWTWSLASFQLRRLQSGGGWPVPLPVLDGCCFFAPLASFFREPELGDPTPHPHPTGAASILTYQMGKLMSQRREDLSQVPKASVPEPIPLPSFSAAIPRDSHVKGDLGPG